MSSRSAGEPVKPNAEFREGSRVVAQVSTDISANSDRPRVLLAILAKQKEAVLPLYLSCIEALDYPTDRIHLLVRTNNNTDRTADLLRDWIGAVGERYASVEFDDTDASEAVERFAVHEWNDMRFRVLARIRQESLQRTLELGCAYYFVVDVDNFIRPDTLRALVDAGLPIAAPLLKCVDGDIEYYNFHEEIDPNGYNYRRNQFYWLAHQRVRGFCEVPVVHCTYLVRSDVIPLLSYLDHSGRHEYVVFSESARRNGVPQYLDNRELYGFLTLKEDPQAAERLLAPLLEAQRRLGVDPILAARRRFQIAQRHFDAGDRARALEAYQDCARFGVCEQEAFVSLRRAADLKAELGYDAGEVIETYLQAHALCETRAEALHAAARYCRILGWFDRAYEFAARALDIAAPANALFPEPWVYDYGARDEYAVSAFWVGRYDECLAACERLLGEGRLPEAMRGRIEQNARLAREKLAGRSVKPQPG